MSALWTAQDAAAATGGRAIGNWAVNGLSIDTRDLAPGDLFVALKDVRDGHDFVAQALKAGAGAALVSHLPSGVAADAPLLIVPDVLVALQDLGRAARARSNAKVIAITGSVGKTTTKEMLRTALAGQGRVHAAVRSFNNHWGVPLTLARMPQDSEFAVIEIGMDHAGEITPLSQMTRPDVALITTVAEVHLAAFTGIADIARAKAEIFTGLETSGVAILNCDIETYNILDDAAQAVDANIITFGAAKAADYHLNTVSVEGNVTIVQAHLHGDAALFKIGAAGRHLAMNGLAVLAAVAAVGADPVVAALDMAHWQPPAGRGARHWILLDPIKSEQRLELIDDAFNANPTSMRAAFEGLAASQPVDGLGRIGKGRRVAFLSDMLELGEDAPARHGALVELAKGVDMVHCAGPLMAHLHAVLRDEQQGEWYETAEELAARVHHLVDAGDVVMVKGSKGSRAALVVDAIKKLSQAGGQDQEG